LLGIAEKYRYSIISLYAQYFVQI